MTDRPETPDIPQQGGGGYDQSSPDLGNAYTASGVNTAEETVRDNYADHGFINDGSFDSDLGLDFEHAAGGTDTDDGPKDRYPDSRILPTEFSAEVLGDSSTDEADIVHEPVRVAFTDTASTRPEPKHVDFATGEPADSDTSMPNPIKVITELVQNILPGGGNADGGEGGGVDAGGGSVDGGAVDGGGGTDTPTPEPVEIPVAATTGTQDAPEAPTEAPVQPDASAGQSAGAEQPVGTTPDTDASSSDAGTNTSPDDGSKEVPQTSNLPDINPEMPADEQENLLKEALKWWKEMTAGAETVDNALGENKQPELTDGSKTTAGAEQSQNTDKSAAEQDDPYRTQRDYNTGDSTDSTGTSTPDAEPETDKPTGNSGDNTPQNADGDKDSTKPEGAEKEQDNLPDQVEDMSPAEQAKLKERFKAYIKGLRDGAEDVDTSLEGKKGPLELTDGSEGDGEPTDEPAAEQDDPYRNQRDEGMAEANVGNKPDAEDTIETKEPEEDKTDKPDDKPEATSESEKDKPTKDDKAPKETQQPTDGKAPADENKPNQTEEDQSDNKPDDTPDNSTDPAAEQPQDDRPGAEEYGPGADSTEETPDGADGVDGQSDGVDPFGEDLGPRPQTVDEIVEEQEAQTPETDTSRPPLADQTPPPPPETPFTPPQPPVNTTPDGGPTATTEGTTDDEAGPSTVLPPIGEATTENSEGTDDRDGDKNTMRPEGPYAGSQTDEQATGAEGGVSTTDGSNPTIQEKKEAAEDEPGRPPRATMSGGTGATIVDDLGSPLDDDETYYTPRPWEGATGSGVDPTTNSGAGTQPNAYGSNEEENNNGGDPNDPSGPGAGQNTSANPTGPNSNTGNANNGEDDDNNSANGNQANSGNDPNGPGANGNNQDPAAGSGEDKARAAKAAKVKARQTKKPEPLSAAEETAMLRTRVRKQMEAIKRREDKEIKPGVRKTLDVVRAIAGAVTGTVAAVSPLGGRPKNVKVLADSKRPGRFPVEFTDAKGNKVVAHIYGKNSADAQKRAEGASLGARIAKARLLVRRI